MNINETILRNNLKKILTRNTGKKIFLNFSKIFFEVMFQSYISNFFSKKKNLKMSALTYIFSKFFVEIVHGKK